MSFRKPQPKITAKARPLRIAYLIEDGADVHKWLDAVFSECFSRHGGRQSLVVPIVDGKASDLYINWLDRFDPDILYLLTYDNEKTAEFFSTRSSPLVFLGNERKRDQPNERPGIYHEHHGLTSLSWLPFLKISSGIFHARPERILDCYPQWQDDGLIIDNFGALHLSFGQFPLHRELNEYIRPLILTPKNAPENRWHFSIDGDEVTDGYEALNSLLKPGQNITLAYLSNLHSKHLRIHSHPWLNSFNLVIGDTFVDRVSCWNGGLLYDDSRFQAYKSLRIPENVIEHEDRITHIANFIRSNNWLGQSNGPAFITVRSSSITKASLMHFLKQLQRTTYSKIIYESIITLDDCCPKDRNFTFLRIEEGLEIQIPLRHDVEFVPVPKPIHLEHTNNANPIYSAGHWMVNCHIDRLNDNNRFANIRDKWILPRRSQISRQFLSEKEGRITNSGLISALVHHGVEQIEVNQPNDSNFFQMLIHEAPHYSHIDLRSKLDYPIIYQYSRPSDKGRYLQGLLGLFQSLTTAHQVLMSHFWRSQFKRLAMPSEEQHPLLIAKLKKRLAPSGTCQIGNDAQ